MVLRDLRSARQAVHPKKCSVEQQEMRYLGFQVGWGQIKPLADLVEVIQSH